MKKMLLSVIFVVIVAMLVFAGCVSFTTNFPDEGNNTSDSSDYSNEPVTYYVPVTNEAGVPVTDFNGESVFVPVSEAPSASVSEVPGSEAENTSSTAVYVKDPSSGSYVPATPTQPHSQQPATNPNTPSKNQDTPATQPNTPAVTPSQKPNTPATQPNVPATQAPAPKFENEYDIFRSGTFVIAGSMNDGTGLTPMEMAITPTSLYMKTNMDNAELAVLVSGGKTYLIYPAKQAYMELTKTMMNMIGMDAEDLLSSEDLGFKDLKPLSSATKSYKATLNGNPCTAYEMSKEDGSVSKIYMNGTKFLGVETVDDGRVISGTYIDSISAVVPADRKSPNSAFEKKTLMPFMALLADVITQ